MVMSRRQGLWGLSGERLRAARRRKRGLPVLMLRRLSTTTSSTTAPSTLAMVIALR